MKVTVLRNEGSVSRSGYAGSSSGGGSGGYADYYALIPNRSAFADLLCDLQVWTDSPGDLLRSLFEHFSELLAGQSMTRTRSLCYSTIHGISRALLTLKKTWLPTDGHDLLRSRFGATKNLSFAVSLDNLL